MVRAAGEYMFFMIETVGFDRGGASVRLSPSTRPVVECLDPDEEAASLRRLVAEAMSRPREEEEEEHEAPLLRLVEPL